MSSLLDEFLRGFGDAVADIRQKVVEEPWFGRAVTTGPERAPEPQPETAKPDLMEAFFQGREVTREELYGKEPERAPEHGHSIER